MPCKPIADGGYGIGYVQIGYRLQPGLYRRRRIAVRLEHVVRDFNDGLAVDVCRNEYLRFGARGFKAGEDHARAVCRFLEDHVFVYGDGALDMVLPVADVVPAQTARRRGMVRFRRVLRAGSAMRTAGKGRAVVDRGVNVPHFFIGVRAIFALIRGALFGHAIAVDMHGHFVIVHARCGKRLLLRIPANSAGALLHAVLHAGLFGNDRPIAERVRGKVAHLVGVFARGGVPMVRFVRRPRSRICMRMRAAVAPSAAAGEQAETHH